MLVKRIILKNLGPHDIFTWVLGSDDCSGRLKIPDHPDEANEPQRQ